MIGPLVRLTHSGIQFSTPARVIQIAGQPTSKCKPILVPFQQPPPKSEFGARRPQSTPNNSKQTKTPAPHLA